MTEEEFADKVADIILRAWEEAGLSDEQKDAYVGLFVETVEQTTTRKH